MSFAGQQPNRRRGCKGYCCRSATEQPRAVASSRKMNFVVVFYLLNLGLLFIAVHDGQHEFCRATTNGWP
jgi:hypothetical protein